MKDNFHQLFTDGAARGNPGPAGAGALIKDPDGNNIEELSEYLGETTNNQAEYRALLLGLKKATELKIQNLKICLDSELIVKQLNGQYRIKHPALRPLFLEVKKLLSIIPKVLIVHVRREYNKEADHLANQAIDQ